MIVILLNSLIICPINIPFFLRNLLVIQKIYYKLTIKPVKSFIIFWALLKKNQLLDYSYWNNKLLYQISHNIDLNDFEKNFQNSVILSKNNLNLKKSLKLFYLRNIPRFSKETRDIVMSN